MKLTNRRIKTVIIFFICVVILSACKGEQSALNDDVILTETEENDVVIKYDAISMIPVDDIVSGSSLRCGFVTSNYNIHPGKCQEKYVESDGNHHKKNAIL